MPRAAASALDPRPHSAASALEARPHPPRVPWRLATVTRRDPETDPKAFLGEELRRGRVAAGFSSQEALAARLGFDRSVVGKAETGDRAPTDDVLAAWCEACQLDADLFTRLAVLARRADSPVPTWFEDWPDLEAAATTLRGVRPMP